MPDVSRHPVDFPYTVDVVVVGAGACGLSAGLAATDGGVRGGDKVGHWSGGVMRLRAA